MRFSSRTPARTPESMPVAWHLHRVVLPEQVIQAVGENQDMPLTGDYETSTSAGRGRRDRAVRGDNSQEGGDLPQEDRDHADLGQPRSRQDPQTALMRVEHERFGGRILGRRPAASRSGTTTSRSIPTSSCRTVPPNTTTWRARSWVKRRPPGGGTAVETWPRYAESRETPTRPAIPGVSYLTDGVARTVGRRRPRGREHPDG